jgi:hypothetical protein
VGPFPDPMLHRKSWQCREWNPGPLRLYPGNLTRVTWRNIPEDGIPNSHRHETLTSYNLTIDHDMTDSVALSPQANYTDWATATCRRNLVPTFVDRGVSRGQRSGSLTVVNLSFLDRITLDHRGIFLILYIVGRTPWTEDHPVERKLLAQRTT